MTAEIKKDLSPFDVAPDSCFAQALSFCIRRRNGNPPVISISHAEYKIPPVSFLFVPYSDFAGPTEFRTIYFSDFLSKQTQTLI